MTREELVCRTCYIFQECEVTDNDPKTAVCNSCSGKPIPSITMDQILKKVKLQKSNDTIKCGCGYQRKTHLMYISPTGSVACEWCAYCTCGHRIGDHEWTRRKEDYERIYEGKCTGRFQHWSRKQKKIVRKFCKCQKPIPITKQINPDEPLPKQAINDPKYRI